MGVEAGALPNYHFVSWTGTAVQAGNVADAGSASTTVTVAAHYDLQANFAIDQRTLTVSSADGGTMTSHDVGASQHDHGGQIVIVAAALPNYHFIGWLGTAVDAGKVADPNSPSTTIVMDSDYTLQANFAIDQRTLTTSSTGGGSVANPGEGQFEYDHGSAVTIEATAEANYHFVNWTGTAVDAGKVANPNSTSTTATADADYTLQANFAIDRHTLTVSSIGGG